MRQVYSASAVWSSLLPYRGPSCPKTIPGSNSNTKQRRLVQPSLIMHSFFRVFLASYSYRAISYLRFYVTPQLLQELDESSAPCCPFCQILIFCQLLKQCFEHEVADDRLALGGKTSQGAIAIVYAHGCEYTFGGRCLQMVPRLRIVLRISICDQGNAGPLCLIVQLKDNCPDSVCAALNPAGSRFTREDGLFSFDSLVILCLIFRPNLNPPLTSIIVAQFENPAPIRETLFLGVHMITTSSQTTPGISQQIPLGICLYFRHLYRS